MKYNTIIIDFSLLVFVKLSFSMVFVQNGIEILGNGTSDFPFSSFEYAFQSTQSLSTEFYLLSSDIIATSLNITGNTTIIGKNLDSVILEISVTLIIANNLTITNLTVISNLTVNSSSAFIVKSFGNLNLINCKITTLFGSNGLFVPFQISSFANFTMLSVYIYEIDNHDLFSFINSDMFSFIVIMNCNFSDINIDSSQLIVGNLSIVSLNTSNFKNISSSIVSSQKVTQQALLFLVNSNTVILFCNFFQSSFFSIPLLIILHEYAELIDPNFYEIKMIGLQFSQITSSNKEVMDSFISISANAFSKIYLRFISFLEMTTDLTIFTISNSNSTHLLNVTFYMTTSNRNFYFINGNFVEILNSTIVTNNLNILSLPLESTIMIFDNIQTKIIDSMWVVNCSSNWTTPVIKIISTGANAYLTQISNSFFSNNRLFYPSDNQAGVILFVTSDNEVIVIENSVFDSNLILPTIIVDQVGGACARLTGANLNISIRDSIFQNNQAIFGCNCIEFDGFELDINNTIFKNNTNYLPPINKDIVESDGYGGSIYSIGGNLKINNSLFTQNMNYFGGNIYLDGNLQRQQMIVDIDQSNFIDNYAHTFGSSIYVADKIQHLRLYMTGSLIYRDWANYNSAIYLSYNSIDAITYFFFCQFIENWSDFAPVLDYECEAGVSYIKNCSFLNNTACWFPRDPGKYVANNNDDYGCGGALFINAKSGPSTMYVYSENNVFSMNYATAIGAILITIGGNFTDNSSIFSFNLAETVGAIYIHIGSMLILNNSTLINNFASDKSCISVREFSYFTLSGCVFKNMMASQGKGLIYVDGICELIITDSIFENITALFGNILFVVFNSDAGVLFKNNVFKNFLDVAEEMFYIGSSTNVVFEGNTIVNCSNRLFSSINAVFTLSNNIIEEISCISVSQEGCIFYLDISNMTGINNFITKINSSADASIFFGQNSLLEINGSMIDSVYSSLNESFISTLYYSSILIYNCSFQNFYPGGFHSVNASLFSINSCIFFQNIKTNFVGSPSLYAEDSLKLIIEFSSFLNNYNSDNGSALNLKCVFSNNITNNHQISFSRFSSNFAYSNGGAAYVQNCPVQINSSNFTDNSAIFMGGAIVFDGTQNFALYDNRFINNSANEGGAITYTDLEPFVDISNIFQQNIAVYGTNISSYPVRFDILNQTDFPLIGRPSTIDSILQNFSLSIIDAMNQTVTTLNNQYILLSLVDSTNNKTIKLTGDIKMEIVNGSVSFNNVFFYSNITTDPLFLEFVTTSISNERAIKNLILTPTEVVQNNQYILRMPMEMTNCSNGEVFDLNLITCLQCPNGMYSLDPLTNSCEECPEEANSCYGDVISLKQGFWRSDVNSTNIYSCTPVSESCLGNYLSNCADGYRGVLCQSCDVSDTIYSKGFANTCIQCSDNYATIIFKLISGSVFLIIFYIYVIYSNLTLIDSLEIDEKTGEIEKNSREKFYSPIYNKILINYFQIISLIKGINLGWTSLMTNLFTIQFVGGNAPAYLYSFDCLIDKNFPIPALYLKILFIAVTPIIGWIIILLYWFILKKVKKIEINNKMTTSTLVLFNILQPTIVNMMSTILSCTEVNGIYYISTDLFFECYDERNVFFSLTFALPSLIFWVIFYPLLNLFRLKKSRNYLNTLQIRKKLGFLYNSYRITYYYFDCFDIYKKYLLILIINYLQISVETKSLIILLILSASTYFLSTKKPYLTKDVNEVAFLADLVSLSTLFFGLLSFSTNDQFFEVFSEIIAITLNIIFLSSFTMRMMIIYKNKILKILSNHSVLRRFMNNFFDNFAKNPSAAEKRVSKTARVLNSTKKILVDAKSK